MRRTLKIHPDSRCVAATSIEVDVARQRRGTIRLHYFVSGTMSQLRLPLATTAERADELWRHTCFEAFVRAPRSTAYFEFNFAPSRRWAAYRFSGYRSGKSVVNEVGAPNPEVSSNNTCHELRASLELDRLSDLADDVPLQIGLSAVIEETSGRMSYWALMHPPGKADFHHSDCFALELPAA